MTTEPLQPVIPTGDPATGEGTTPDSVTAGTGTAPPAETPNAEPDAAYKGIQRALAKAEERARAAESQLASVGSQPADQQSAAIVAGLLQEIAKTDPDRANALAGAYQQYRTAAENQALRNKFMYDEQEKMILAAEASNMQELRATAKAFGADPDSRMIDYGDPETETIAQRLARVRESATRAAAPANPVAPPIRQDTHNVQPGTPPTPPVNNAGVTEETMLAAQAEYARTYQTMSPASRAEAEAKLRVLNEQFAKQTFE